MVLEYYGSGVLWFWSIMVEGDRTDNEGLFQRWN